MTPLDRATTLQSPGSPIVMAPPVYVVVDSRQKKRTMIKNKYAAVAKTAYQEAAKTNPQVESSEDNYKPTATDQRIPQSVLDQMSAHNKTLSQASKAHVNDPSQSSTKNGPSSVGSKHLKTEQSITSSRRALAAADVSELLQSKREGSRRKRLTAAESVAADDPETAN